MSFQFSDSIDCGSFRDDFTDFYNGTITTYYDAAGHPTKEVLHLKHVSNDVNSVTGYVIHEHGSFTEIIDNRKGTDTITGSQEIASKPGTGVVIADVGRLVFDADGNFVSLSTSNAARSGFTYSDERYCSALST